MKEMADTKISLNKLKIRFIILIKMLKKLVDRIFYKCKV